jgi:hypothetical protein
VTEASELEGAGVNCTDCLFVSFSHLACLGNSTGFCLLGGFSSSLSCVCGVVVLVSCFCTGNCISVPSLWCVSLVSGGFDLAWRIA